MSIRLKLAVVLTLGMTSAAVAAALVFAQLQRRTLKAVEQEKVNRLMEDVSRIANESQLAKDPLMLLDYLAYLMRDRKEVRLARANISGQFEGVGADENSAAAFTDRDVVLKTLTVSSPGQKPIEIEVYFSRQVLEERERKALEAMLRDMTRSVGFVILIAVLVSFVLGWTLTRRIVNIENAIDLIGQGRLGAQVESTGSDEIGRLAQGLNAMSERLRELEQIKKTFVASVTHELRSPLGAIESYVARLLEKPERWSEEDRRNLERIRGNAGRLGHFVTNVLEMAKIERGKLDYRPVPADVSRLVEDTVLFFSAKAEEAKIELKQEIESGLPHLRMDVDLIPQVITNFISNALKFTRPGGQVSVSARRAVWKGKPAVRCAVADTGVGIPEEALGRIFAPFERVRNPLKATGAGLGLAISKSIIEMHGGEIFVESKVGQGSTFGFVLPAAGNGNGRKNL